MSQILRPLIALFIFLATSAAAQDWFMRDDDILFTMADLDTRLRGQTITFYDDGEAQYFTNDSYRYTYAGSGGSAEGQYKVFPGSIVCIDFTNGFSRCDRFVLNNDRLVMITETRNRFPVRPD